MRLSLDPSAVPSRDVTPESLALARWYDANPAVRRLWGIRNPNTLTVVVALEPTHDGDDVFPTWAAHSGAWARELRSVTRSAVQLELFRESSLDETEFHAEGVVIADLFWRDPSVTPSPAAS